MHGLLCWNTATGTLRIVDSAEAAMLTGEAGAATPDSFERIESFRKDGMLVPDDLDERAQVERDLVENTPTGIYRILTTTACNAACDYCYERNLTPVHMSRETAHAVAEFIAMRQFEHADSPILEWFGGEPLVNHRAITDICRALDERGVRFDSKITTNGSLWTDELIHDAKRIWNLQSVQFTLDGVGEAHERSKHLPAGTYQQTLESVQRLLEQDIRVNVRIVHLPGRVAAERELIGELARVFPNCERFTVYVAPAYQAGTMQPVETMRNVLLLEKLIRNAGLDGSSHIRPGGTPGSIAHRVPVLPRRRHSACFMCSPGNFTIAPDGRLYNCSHAICDQQRVGTVQDYSPEQEFAEPRATFLRRDVAAMCRDCKLLPVCMGGCRVAELGLAPMTQCLPARSVIPELMEEAYLLMSSCKAGD